MVSAPGMFFAGIGTAALLIGAGFGGGVLLGKAAVDSRAARTAEAPGSLPAARVVLPAMAEVTPSSERPAETIVKSTPPLPAESSIPAVAPVPVNDFREQDRESEKQAARQAEKEQKQVAKKAAGRERHKRYAAQKQQQEQELRQQQ